MKQNNESPIQTNGQNNVSNQNKDNSETFEIYGDPNDDNNDNDNQPGDEAEQIAMEAEENFDEKVSEPVVNVDVPVVVGRARIFTVTNNFRITQPLGEDAYGRVFAAIDNHKWLH